MTFLCFGRTNVVSQRVNVQTLSLAVIVPRSPWREGTSSSVYIETLFVPQKRVGRGENSRCVSEEPLP